MDQKRILNMLASMGRGGKGKAKASPGSADSPPSDSRALDRVNAIIDAWKQEQDGSQGKFDLEGTLKSIVTKQDEVAAGGQVPRSMTDPDYGAEEPAGKQPSRVSTAADILQLGLDAVGVIDPTPITDGVNSAISLGRAFVTDPERRGEHLQNAAISAVSMVPYIGDTAKLAKGGRAARTVSRAANHLGGGATTLAGKQAARERLRDGTESVLNAGGGFGGSEYAPGGPGGGGPPEPPPSPSDPNQL